MTSRRSIMLGLALSALLGVFGLNSVYAQVPRSISYQGQLLKNGQAVNGTVNLQISIYDAAGVTPLYQESMNGVVVSGGIFNVMLGGNSGTLPQSLKFDEQYYLGVNVDNAGEVQPRTPFSAAPYALNAQTVGGIGVSVTPQPGMLLPLDGSGKLPKSVLPLPTAAPVNTINNIAADGSGNIQIVPGTPNVTIGSPSANTISISVSGGSAGIQTVQAGPGLQGGGSTPTVMLQIAPNGITPGMLGVQSVTARNLDQNIPQWGLWQDPIGQLNVGVDSSLTFAPAMPNAQVPGMPTRKFGSNGAFSSDGIGINLAHTNNFIAVQNFLGGLTGSLGTITTAVIGTLGTNAQALTVNGLAEPLAGPNGALFYEIQDNGDLRVTGSTTTTGNTFIGITNTNAASANTMGTPSWSANTITGLTNTVAASNGAQTNVNTSNTISAASSGTGIASNSMTATSSGTGAASNTIQASGSGSSNNSIQAPINNIGTAGNTNNNIGQTGASANVIAGATNAVSASTTNTVTAGTSNSITAGTSNAINAATTNTLTATTSNNLVSQLNNIGTNQTAGGVNNIGLNTTSTNNVQGVANNIGTTQVAGNTNTIGTANNSTNNVNGVSNSMTATTTPGGTVPTNNITATGNGTNATNTMTATGTATASNNLVAQNNNIGTTQTAGGQNTIGTPAISTTTIHNNVNIGSTGASPNNTINIGSAANNTSTSIFGFNATMNATNNNLGTNAASTNTIGSATSTNTINGTTTFNGVHNVNGASTFTGATVIHGSLTQDLGLVNLAGAAGANSFGSAAGANNTIGNAGSSVNTIQGGTNNITATTPGTGINTITGVTNNTVGTGVGGANNSDAQIIRIGTSGNGTTNATVTIGTGNTATVGQSANTLNGNSNTLNAVSSAGTPGQNLLLATNGTGIAGATNKLDATSGLQNWATGTFRQTGNATFTGGNSATVAAPGATTTFDQETVSGLSSAGSNSTIVRFSTIQADNNFQVGPSLATQTYIQNSSGPNFQDNASGPAIVQLSTGSGVIPTIQLVDVVLVNGSATLTSGVSNTGTYGNPPNLGVNRTLYFDNNSAPSVQYINNITPQGSLTVNIVAGVMTITSSWPFDGNTVRVKIFRQ